MNFIKSKKNLNIILLLYLIKRNLNINTSSFTFNSMCSFLLSEIKKKQTAINVNYSLKIRKELIMNKIKKY